MRLRIRFAKTGKVRFVGHRDVARLWERGLRKASLSVAYSEGFSPRPRLSFGLALSTGYESNAEYLEVELREPFDDATWDCWKAEEVRARIDATLPVGIDVLAVAPSDRGEDSLQKAVTSCTWEIIVDGIDVEEASTGVLELLGRSQILLERERKGKIFTEDIRHQLLALEVNGDADDGVRLIADLGTQPRALRPGEMLAAMDPPLTARSVCRMNQWMLQGNDRIEPLSVDAAPAPLAEVRA
ncbi:MAG: TIGR03936 family radical SAM-associated protein [Acidimicrobiales bacterium]|jgi:radical SAM-linked protein|nr:TIGR03936 family radical SAM-associated protein [Acidimicrobiales bacterium]MDP7259240.1 TIGR03936 family radical SAM-associated protein [Acidimicrobiales bacterium]HCV37077.1 hypothetical protein [Acidimicrobiaceae bacterium]HJO79818.1 TIGR03936 family radical SAM-associated protein [Acidimicrobiales bacterium]|tara:strand:- start:2336 stop:3061 length:726 start_codon:yes stop_codon:yes gene_type:complete